MTLTLSNPKSTDEKAMVGVMGVRAGRSAIAAASTVSVDLGALDI